MRRRRRPSLLPRGPALVAAGLLGLVAPACGKKKDEEPKVEPRVVPPQIAPDDAMKEEPQVVPADDATASPPPPDAADGSAAKGPPRRTLDNLPGKLKPVPEDRRIKKNIKVPQPDAPVMPNRDLQQKSEHAPTKPPLVGPFDRSS